MDVSGRIIRVRSFILNYMKRLSIISFNEGDRMKLMRLTPRFIGMICIILGVAVSMPAQRMIGAKAGIVDYVIGKAFLDEKPLRISKENHIQMENGQVLSTKSGRAELLVAVSAYLRLGENSSLLMENNRLDGSQLAIIKGVALIEVVERIKVNPISVRILSSVIKIQKAGLYRVDSDRCDLRVYEGAASTSKENKEITVRKGGSMRLEGKLMPMKFDTRVVDSLYVWSGFRSFSLFVSNPSNRNLPNWKLTAKGDLKNTNYNLRFQTNATWVENWKKQETRSKSMTQAFQDGSPNSGIDWVAEFARRRLEAEEAKAMQAVQQQNK